MKIRPRLALLRLDVVLGLLALAATASTCSAGPGPLSYELLPSDSAPRIFAEGVISTPDDESGGVFSPDGKEFYFTKLNATTTFPRIALLCVSHWRDGAWSTPEVLPFSGRSLDFPPRLSPNGREMYFASSRIAGGLKPHVLRIWKTTKTDAGWTAPEALPAPVNAPEDRWNWGASVTRDGTIYFASDREQQGHPQIYRSRMVNGAYQDAEKLGPEVNSDFNDYDPFISADESLLFFVSSGEGGAPFGHRPDTLYTGGYPYARGDIYVSRNVGGKWTKAKHLEHGVNTVADEDYPSLTPDGKHLVFSSERSPFTVPTPRRLTMDLLEKELHSTLNGHGNVFTIPVRALEIENEK
jgi:hypothetical protein